MIRLCFPSWCLLRLVLLSVFLWPALLAAAPQPAPEAVVGAAPEKLKWDAVAGALSYEVYFGASRPLVAAAQKPPAAGSAPWLGSTTTTEIAAPQSYSPGGVWFWRVDAVTATTTIKGAVQHYTGQLSLRGNLRGPNSYYGVQDQTAAIDGDAAMVGYPGWVSVSSTPRPGQVAVFRRAPGQSQWTATQTLNKPSGSAADARFGTAILMRGRTAWISAPGDESVYKYQQDAASGQWSYSGVRLQPPANLGGGKFGTALAQGPGWLAVGVPETGNASDEQRGMVDIFDPDTGVWKVRLTPPTHTARTDRIFGGILAGDGDTLIAMNSAFETQNVRVEVFNRSATGTWSLTTSLSSPNTSSNLIFAQSLSMSGNVLLVGTPTRSSATAARVYVWEQSPTRTWTQTARFDPTTTGDGFIMAMTSIRANRAAVYWFRSGTFSPEVALYQRESDATWARMGTTIQTAPADVATGRVSTIAISDAFVMQAGHPDSPTIRFYLHNTDANAAPVFTSSPVLFGEGGKSYLYTAAASDPNAGDIVSLTAGTLPAWLTFTPQAGGTGILAGTPPPGFTGDIAIQLTATDAKGASSVQAFTLKIVAAGVIPVITSLSPDTTVDDHSPLELNVTIEGTAAAAFQWFWNGVPLAGQNSARLRIAHAQSSDAGAYTVIITRGAAFVESAAIQVAVRQIPDRFGGDWPTLGAGPSHAGRYSATLGSHAFVPAWTNSAPAANTVANQAAVADGKAFLSFSIDRTSAPTLRCVDLFTGAQVWTRALPLSTSFSAPTFHRNVLYTQRAKAGSDSPDIRAFDAATGNPRWTANYDDQYAVPWAPAVSDSGVYVMGGQHGGLYRYTLAGAQQWYITAPQRDEWTPLLHNDRLFTWTGGLFDEVSKSDGLKLWTLTTDWDEWLPYTMGTVPAAEGTTAAILDKSTLRLVDLNSRTLTVSRTGTFAGSPAIADGLVYVISSGAIRVFRVQDGTEQAAYPTLTPGGAPVTGVHQPVILDDVVLVSSATDTWVFDRSSRALRQRLPAGGPLTYSDGVLMAAGSDGTVRAFAVNQSPRLTPPSQPLQWTEDTPGTAWALPVFDADGDIPAVTAVNAPPWMTVSGFSEGTVVLSGMPVLSAQAGDFTVTLRLDDHVSPVTEVQVPCRVIAVNDTPLVIPPPDITIDEDTDAAPVNVRAFFADEEDTPGTLTYAVDEPPPGLLRTFSFDAVTGNLTLSPAADYAGTITLTVRTRDSGGLEASTPLRLVVRPVPDAPRLVPSPTAPVVNVDGSPVTFGAAPFFTDPDEGDIMRYSLAGNGAPQLFRSAVIDAATGAARLEWAPYLWGRAVLTIRCTDSFGLSTDTTVAVELPAPASPSFTLNGATRINRQTGLVEQTVVIRNGGPRALGGFTLWLDAGAGAVLYNGSAAPDSVPGNSTATPGSWLLPYHVPLAAGAEITLVLEFYSLTRTARPEIRDAVPINGTVPETTAEGTAGRFAVRRIMPVEGGMLVEFPSEPGSSYQMEYSADGAAWRICPLPIRAGGTAVQWIDRGPPFTLSAPAPGGSRFYRVRRL